MACDEAIHADRLLGSPDGTGEHFLRYKADLAHADARLTERGRAQALATRQRVLEWGAKPVLIVSSPLTRSIQTAAIVFEEELAAGARLVIRPEIREYFADFPEAQGRSVAELRQCPTLRRLAQWPAVAAALSDEATAEWRAAWDERWARGSGGAWEAHCGSAGRMQEFRTWLLGRPEPYIAVVSHWGTINNYLNREPWAAGLERTELPWPHDKSAWPAGGLARMFNVPNCGWIVVRVSPA